MKIRNGYVSNSSSSSFVVIQNSGPYQKKYDTCWETVTVPSIDRGCAQFWWQFEEYYDFWSKLNWCAICINDMRELERIENSEDRMKRAIKSPWLESKAMEKMLKKVCEEKLGLDIKVVETDYHSSIDHQSAVYEEPENARMFQTDIKLYDFLANADSYISCGNDNEDAPNGPRLYRKDYSE